MFHYGREPVTAGPDHGSRRTVTRRGTRRGSGTGLAFLVEGDPDDAGNFSGIPYHFSRQLHAVARDMGIGVSVRRTDHLLNVQELLHHVARPAGGNGAPSRLDPRKAGHPLNAALLDAAPRASSGAELRAVLETYYDTVARHVRDDVLGTGELGALSQNHLYPYAGPDPRISYYLDASLVSFYFDPVRGVVPEAERPPAVVELYTEMEARALHAAPRIYCFSASLAAELRSRYGIGRDRLRVVGAGPNLATLPSPIERPARREVRLLFIGRDFERKGGKVLLSCMRILGGGPFELHVVTEPPHRTVAPNVHFHAPCSARERDSMYRLADVFVFPTLFEPFGLVVCEAMAYSLPVVATTTGALPEILGPASAGLLLDPACDDLAERLAATVAALAADPSLCRRLGLENRRRVEERYTWRRAAQAVLADMLERGGGDA